MGILIKCKCSELPVPAKRHLRSKGKGNPRQAVNVCCGCGREWRTIRRASGRAGAVRAARALAFVVGLVLCLTNQCGPLEAAEATVTPELVCAVQGAIRWREPAWSTAKCGRVATAISLTAAPVSTLAIAINESDLRERAIAWHGPDVADVGLMGVRCQLGTDRRCTNGAAKGLSVADLQKAEANIAVGAAILAGKGSVGRYNSGTPSIGNAYEARISVLAAALSGVPVDPRKIKGARLRKLVEQIAAVLANGRNS